MPETDLIPSGPAAPWRDILTKDPFDPIALAGLGRVMLRHGAPAQAVPLLLDAVEYGAGLDALTDLTTALMESGQGDEAEPWLRRALEEAPGRFDTTLALGQVLLDTGRHEQALPFLHQALTLAPHNPDAERALVRALVERGNTQFAAGDPIAAEATYREALAYGLERPTCHTNLGNALTFQLRLPEARAEYETALRLAPDNDLAGFAYALCLLLDGDNAGWRPYESRRRVEPARRDHERRPDLPQWQPGTDLTGKRVLLTAEQGIGDLIQYPRFAPALARIAAEVVLELPWNLTRLFRDLPGVARTITLEDKAERCDVACPLLSLPLLLGPDAGLTPPYIPVPAERTPRWQRWLDRSPPGRRIGLVCSGDPRHRHDARRSIPLADLTPLLSVPDTAFVLLQTEIRDTDRPAFEAQEDLRCPEAALTDYADTAALIGELDLVISVDTSVAHLAGAMGRPVWTLLPYCPDYRWRLERSDTDWYPSMRLFRQDRPNDWRSVIERVRAELANER